MNIRPLRERVAVKVKTEEKEEEKTKSVELKDVRTVTETVASQTVRGFAGTLKNTKEIIKEDDY